MRIGGYMFGWLKKDKKERRNDMGEKSKVKVKDKQGEEYVIEYDGHHYRAYKEGKQVSEPFVMVTNLLKQIGVEVSDYDKEVTGKNDEVDTPADPNEKAPS